MCAAGVRGPISTAGLGWWGVLARDQVWWWCYPTPGGAGKIDVVFIIIYIINITYEVETF